MKQRSFLTGALLVGWVASMGTGVQAEETSPLELKAVMEEESEEMKMAPTPEQMENTNPSPAMHPEAPAREK